MIFFVFLTSISKSILQNVDIFLIIFQSLTVNDFRKLILKHISIILEGFYSVLYHLEHIRLKVKMVTYCLNNCVLSQSRPLPKLTAESQAETSKESGETPAPSAISIYQIKSRDSLELF